MKKILKEIAKNIKQKIISVQKIQIKTKKLVISKHVKNQNSMNKKEELKLLRRGVGDSIYIR